MIAKSVSTKKHDIRLILDNIRSVHNVGSIFRTAETLGISTIYCIGTTPAPFDRFGLKRKDFAKVSLGAEEMVRWEHVDDDSKSLKAFLAKLKKEGFQIIAVEQSERAVDYRTVRLKDKAAIILGNEVDGVGANLLKFADMIAEIPLHGRKESLNVSVAAGVALFRMVGR